MWLPNLLFPSVRRLVQRASELEAELERVRAAQEPQVALPLRPGSEDEAMAEHNAFISEFYSMLGSRPLGRLLEIGARNRTSADRKPIIPKGWTYDGLDFTQDERDVWVTIIADAHDMRTVIPHGSFDAVISVATFEHLLMPWRVALELNHVMCEGALLCISTHQTYPLHELPADYWRFSDSCWPGIFNHRTGFRIIRTLMCRPASIVPHIRSPLFTSIIEAPAYVHSLLLAEKVGEATVNWDVAPQEISPIEYPHEQNESN